MAASIKIMNAHKRAMPIPLIVLPATRYSVTIEGPAEIQRSPMKSETTQRARRRTCAQIRRGGARKFARGPFLATRQSRLTTALVDSPTARRQKRASVFREIQATSIERPSPPSTRIYLFIRIVSSLHGGIDVSTNHDVDVLIRSGFFNLRQLAHRYSFPRRSGSPPSGIRESIIVSGESYDLYSTTRRRALTNNDNDNDTNEEARTCTRERESIVLRVERTVRRFSGKTG